MTESQMLNVDESSISGHSNSTDQSEEDEQEDGSGSHLQGLQHLETKRVKDSEETPISMNGYSVDIQKVNQLCAIFNGKLTS